MRHDIFVYGAVFSKDEKRILSWSEDRTIRLWDVKTHKQIGGSMRHDEVVLGAAFSKDEKRILSWSNDKTIRLWDVKTHKQIGQPMRHDEIVLGAAFSKDEKQILSWSIDKTIRLWNIKVDLDIPPSLYALQVKVFLGLEMDMETKELLVLDPVIREQMLQEYEKKAREHYKVCKYPEANVWRRFHIEEAEKVRYLR
jgi:WD40 repeat protein